MVRWSDHAKADLKTSTACQTSRKLVSAENTEIEFMGLLLRYTLSEFEVSLTTRSRRGVFPSTRSTPCGIISLLTPSMGFPLR